SCLSRCFSSSRMSRPTSSTPSGGTAGPPGWIDISRSPSGPRSCTKCAFGAGSVRSGERGRDACGDGLRLPGGVLRPRPEEPLEPVALPPGHDVEVHVRDALAHLVVERDE